MANESEKFTGRDVASYAATMMRGPAFIQRRLLGLTHPLSDSDVANLRMTWRALLVHKVEVDAVIGAIAKLLEADSR